MDGFNERLVKVLKKDPRFVDEQTRELVRNEVVNSAYKIDKELISLLLEDKELKSKFFFEIKGHWVFDINLFVSYIQDKSFLSDSYTKFKNKIGLNVDGKFLNERKEVSLVWPFKDCVLEGGMTKDDEKRNEIFFNEVLAEDEINRLLDTKVLTNFKRFTPKKEEKVKEFNRDKSGTIKDNLIIKGNNLLALHSLKREFAGKIKLIYIDPPYNTGGDSFAYNDNFNHSSWLTFMKNRLEACKFLMQDDALVWINIDDNEVHYLKVLCDEIFGRENFVANVVWEKADSPRMDAKTFSTRHDHLLVFAKNLELSKIQKIKSDTESMAHYSKIDSEGKKYYLKPLRSMGKNGTREARPSLYYSIKAPDGTEIYPKNPDGSDSCWRWNKEKLKNDFKKLEFIKTKTGWSINTRIYAENNLTKPPETIWYHDEVGSNRNSKSEITKLFGGSVLFETPKPEKLLQKILKISTVNEDRVLDFFSGSGTTAAVCAKMNRQFIAVEQMNYIDSVTINRLVKVIEGEMGGISEDVEWEGGGEFIYCELMKHNEEAIETIQDAKDTKKLLKIWGEMCNRYFLNYDVSINNFKDNHREFEKLTLVQQKKLLCEMLNKNHLYVNLSEIDDSEFKVSKEDKELNKLFYD